MKSYFNLARYSQYSTTILRLGVAGVVIWFGASQLLSQAMWTSFIPDWALSITGLSATKLVILNGIFEVVTGTLLALGICIRPVAFLLFLHLCSIVMSVGLSPLGIRDIAIATGLLSVALYENDPFSWKQQTSEASSNR